MLNKSLLLSVIFDILGIDFVSMSKHVWVQSPVNVNNY